MNDKKSEHGRVGLAVVGLGGVDVLGEGRQRTGGEHLGSTMLSGYLSERERDRERRGRTRW